MEKNLGSILYMSDTLINFRTDFCSYPSFPESDLVFSRLEKWPQYYP